LADTVLRKYLVDTNFVFWGVPDTISHSEAGLDTSFSIQDGILKYKIYSIFFPNKSYMKIRTPDVLSHEQIHFDILEANARALRKYVRTKVTKKNAKEVGKEIYNIVDQNAKMNRSFDSLARIDLLANGDVYYSDSVWRIKVDKALYSLKDYRHPTGKVKLK
jgi:hypothetical protein